MEPMGYALLLLTGFGAGFTGGLLGIGGCVIMLPVLAFVFNYPLPYAIGTTITAVILTASSGAVAHIRLKNVDYETVKVVFIAGIFGAITGSLLFIRLSSQLALLNLILGLAFLYVSLRMVYEGIRRARPKAGTKRVPGSTKAKALVGFFVGTITGIVGLGGGYALVPSFVYLLGSGVKIAVGTSLPSFIGMAIISGAFKLYQGYVDLPGALLLGVGTVIGAQIGARMVPRAPAWAIKAVFGAVFLYVSIKFIVHGLGLSVAGL